MRARSRFISLVAVACLITALLPVGPASGVVDAGGVAGRSAPATRAPVVKTSAKPNGISVSVSNLAKEVTGFDVYRSGAAGELGSKINDKPVTGSRYFDATAEPGVQYFYTVKVAGRAASKDGAVASRFVTPDSLDQVKADVGKARADSSRGASKPAAIEKDEAPLAKGAPADPDVVSKLAAVTYGAGGVTTTLTAANTVWSPAGGPYFIRGDVIVPAGKTLTILPGTKVYFDTFVSGVSVDATEVPMPGVRSVTQKADIIVHGKIVAKGTSASRILFTSINSLVASASADYAAGGDWGCVFTDSKAASEILYCQFEFGTYGIWAHNTLRPYVRNSVFKNNTGPFPWGAISFTNPPAPDATTSRIIISGNRIDGYGEGIDVLMYSLGTDTSNRVVDPYIVGNTITGDYPLEMYCYDFPRGISNTHGGKYGNVYIKGYVANNTFTTTDYPVYLDGWADGDGKSCSITTVFSGNTIVTSGYNGVYSYAGTAGTQGSAYSRPSFTRDKITTTGSYDAVYAEAFSQSGADTSTANAYAAPSFTSCQIRATGADAVELYADANGKGTASVNAAFSGGTVQSAAESAIEAYAESEYGNAYASPSFTNVAGRAWIGSEVLYAEAETFGVGKATASPRWVGGSNWSSDDDGIYAYAESDEGSAESRPYVYNAEFRVYENCIDAEAYASNDSSGTGSANASPIVVGSDLISNEYDAVYCDAYTGGSGSAVSSPSIRDSSLVSEYYYGLETYAQSQGGASTSSPILTDTTVWSYDGMYVSASRSGDGTRTAHVNASPRFTRSTVVTKYDDSVYIDAGNSGVGSCFVKPVVYYSDIVNSYDYDGFYAESSVSQTGTAEVAPVMTGSNIKADYDALDLEADAATSGGVAKSNGTFTNCTFSSSWDNGYYGYAYSNNGVSENMPKFTNCTVESPNDYAYESDARVEGVNGISATASPAFSGGSIPMSGDGIGVWADSFTSGSTAKVTVAPRIVSMPVVSQWDYGIYTWAYSYSDGHTYNNSYVYNSPVTSYNGVVHEAISTNGGLGNAYNYAKTLGVSSARRMRIESFDDHGVYNYSYASAANAYDRTQQRYLSISSGVEAVLSRTQSDGGAGTAASSAPIISSIVSDMLWGADAEGVQVESHGGNVATATASPTISYNTLRGSYSDGISVRATGGGHTVASPNVSANSVTQPIGNGILVEASGPTVDGKPTIAKNTVTRPQLLGIYLDGVPGGTVSQNKVVDPGWAWGSVDGWNSACLTWDGADPDDASVWNNMFVGGTFGVFYLNGAPKTNYNYFADAYGMVNRPWNYGTSDSPSSDTPYVATKNWWGTTSSSVISSTISTGDNHGVGSYAGPKTDLVSWGSALASLKPRVSSIGVAKTATTVKFTVRFDRPMNTAVRRLYFGTASPYRTFYVNGSWSADGMTFVGTRSRSGLPTARTMYFSGAKDVWGNAMLSTTRGFRL